MKIGIEFISSIKIVDGIAAYTGGTNYAKTVLNSLKKNLYKTNSTIVLFVPVGFQANCEDNALFYSDGLNMRYSSSIDNCDFSDVDVMFFPQVNGRVLRILPNIKKKFPHIKICATLHDRQHNFYRFDWYDRFYFSGFRRTGIISFVEFFLKKMVFKIEYGRCVKYIDKIFTVSNCSMQKLMHKNVREIKYFVQESAVEKYKPIDTLQQDFALFVGGGRPEKNLLRTLEAFCVYKNKSKSQIKLKVTGVSEIIKQNLLKSRKIDYDIVTESVEFFSYVSYQKLVELYSCCRYVVFTSKGEGYGLPIREAMEYGKTILASRTTSVPEVAGATLNYVDPFDVNSICKGFQILDDEETLIRLQEYIIERNVVIKKIARQDTSIMVDEIIAMCKG